GGVVEVVESFGNVEEWQESGLFAPPIVDLSNSGLEEFKQPEFESYGPKAILTKSGIIPISIARQSSSRAAAPVSTTRPINTAAPKPIVKSVNTVNTAKGKSMTSAVGKQETNVVKSSACWVWRPKIKVQDHVSKNSGSYICKRFDYVDPKGRLKSMCDKKNSVLFTKIEYLILSPDFKLPDENPVLLKVSRKNNMYCFDLKNVVPSKGLTCLLSKATNDESNLWHRRLGIENQLNHKVKIIRCDNGTEFKNYEMNQFYGIKGIKREFSNARTPQQNRVAKRKNRTLIEAARTILADSLLPILFWAKEVNTACYVQNRVIVTKPHNKIPYELLIGREPIISFMRPFGCPVTILNTLDHLGKFDGKADKGFLVGYSINNKAFRVYNNRTKMVEENLHVNFLEDKPNVTGSDKKEKKKMPDQEYILLLVLNTSSDVSSSNEEVVSSPKDDIGKKSTVEPTCVKGGKSDDLGSLDQQMKSTYDSENTDSTNNFNTASPTVNTASDKDRTFQRNYDEWNFSTPITVNAVSFAFSPPAALDDFSKMPNLEDSGIFNDAYDDRDEGMDCASMYKNHQKPDINCTRIEATRKARTRSKLSTIKLTVKPILSKVKV
nr:ribonuclease H-like domain-containing protein [Tanacetum cinerariifolium]